MFNKPVRTGYELTQNDANYEVYKLPSDKAFFFMSCAFKPFNSAYRSEIDNLNRLIDAVKNTNKKFAHALNWYLGTEFGLRLAPAIVAAELYDNYQDHKRIQKIVNDTFVRPDFFAHALDYYKFKHNLKSLNQVPREFLDILRNKFEKLPAHTLKNRKMRRRQIKTKDLIKVLRPRPKDSEMSNLYKSIIEDGPDSKLKVETDEETGEVISADHATSVLSDDSIDQVEKEYYFSENIDNININALIRNLTKLSPDDANKVKNRLDSVLSDPMGRRIVNPLDLIMIKNLTRDEIWKYCERRALTLNETTEKNVDNKITQALDETLEKYYNLDFNVQNPLILFDNSGSMYFNNHYSIKLASKYMALLKSLFEKNTLKFFFFHTRPFEVTQKALNLEGLSHSNFANEFYKLALSQDTGGTALLYSMELVLRKSPNIDSLIIITDEQTWCEPNTVTHYKSLLRNYKLNGRSIIVNTDPVGGNSVFQPDADIFRIGGYEGKIVDCLKAIYSWNEFKKEITDRFENLI